MGSRLSGRHRRALYLLLGLGVAVLGLLAVGLLLFDRGLRGKYEPVLARMRQDVTDNVDFFCEQQGVLAKDAWFHEPRTEGDAGPLLNAWMGWEPQRELPRDSPLAIPAHLPRSNADFKDWLTSSVDVSTLDFGWMRRLHAYDRWDILRNTPVPPAEPFNWANASLPDFIPLQLWAKFRLLHGLRTGQPLEAARDVRHLAWLLYRTESVIGATLAAALLQLEHDAYDSMQAPPPQWRPMSREQVARMRAVVMSSLAFSHIAAPVEVARKARRCGEPAVTRCLAMAEASFMAKYLQPFARDDYREAYAAFEEDLTASPCTSSISRLVWERGMTIEDPHPADSGLPEQPRVLRGLPRWYFGSHISAILLSIGTPSLKHLHEFREKLASGTFEAKRATPSPR